MNEEDKVEGMKTGIRKREMQRRMGMNRMINQPSSYKYRLSNSAQASDGARVAASFYANKAAAPKMGGGNLERIITWVNFIWGMDIIGT